ncbi:dienelactone hydrolase family protein [Arthrobacter sp. NPDC089319]|uniref:alpha/beta hydrolase n=1 Tax=Arthrobacter sp. NPDC089319 TaxID=3155915 RepID=UPI00341FF335
MTETTYQPVVAWSKPEQERTGTPLLVLFHGYGSHEQDLMGLVPGLPEEFTVAAVRAPVAMGPGFTWFPLMHEPDFSVDKVTQAVGDVVAWLDSVKGQHSSVSVLGFSMGMAVATSVLRHRPEEIAAVVGLSGFAVPAEGNDFFRDDAVKAIKPPVFWGRDQEDPVITADKIEFTHEWANEHVDLTKVLYSGIGHGINAQELSHVKEFLTYKVLNAQ